MRTRKYIKIGNTCANTAVASVIVCVLTFFVLGQSLATNAPKLYPLYILLLNGLLVCTFISGIVAIWTFPKVRQTSKFIKGLVGIIVPMIVFTVLIPWAKKSRAELRSKDQLAYIKHLNADRNVVLAGEKFLGVKLIDENNVEISFETVDFASSEVDLHRWNSIVIPRLRERIIDTVYFPFLQDNIDLHFIWYGSDNVEFSRAIFLTESYIN